MSFRTVVRRPQVVGALLIGSVIGALCGGACSGSPTTASPPPPSCTFSLSSSSFSLASDGGTAQVSVSTAAACTWTAQSPASWVTVSATSFTGPGAVTLTVSANASSEGRSAALTVAGQSVAVNQSGRQVIVCVYSVRPDDVNVPSEGANGRIDVDTGTTCPWDAIAHDNWIRVAGTNPRTGPGSVSYTADPHTGPVGRLGRLTVAGTEVLVHQAASAATSCSYAVTPTSMELPWHRTSGNAIVTTGDGCPWTASTDASWLTLATPSSMVGSGTATVTMTTYKDLQPREGRLMLRWPTPTAGLNVVVRQYGCGYSVDPAVVNVAAAGGRASATVFGATQSANTMIECPWLLTTRASWLHLRTTQGEGLSTVSFDVDANTTGLGRCESVIMSDPDVARASFQVCQAQ
jgi:Viral BACON domain/Putative binding domain, N-terminal